MKFLDHIKKLALFLSLILIQISAHSEEILYDFDTSPTTFPTAIFGPPTAAGYEAGILRFLPIRALDGDLLYHIHVEDVNQPDLPRDGDIEMSHHADAGGWFAESIDGSPFSLNEWIIEKLSYEDASGDTQPLIIDGYLNNVKVASLTLTEGTKGLFVFPDEFHNIDMFEVYFETWRGKKPPDVNPVTGEGKTIHWNIIIDDMRVESIGATQPQPVSIFPAEGMWWNPARNGHGIDIEFDGANLAVAWYTYNEDGSPTWYLASGPFSGTTWTAQVETYTWDGNRADGTSVGSISLEFTDATHANLSWIIDGAEGSQPIEYFVTSTEPALLDLTGLWYEEAKPGYGLTLSTQGDSEFAVVYFYDSDGKPRWVLGIKEEADTYNLLQYSNGFCPGCPVTTPDSFAVGTLTRIFDNGNKKGFLTVDIQLQPPLDGIWQVSGAEISNLSNP